MSRRSMKTAICSKGHSVVARPLDALVADRKPCKDANCTQLASWRVTGGGSKEETCPCNPNGVKEELLCFRCMTEALAWVQHNA